MFTPRTRKVWEISTSLPSSTTVSCSESLPGSSGPAGVDCGGDASQRTEKVGREFSSVPVIIRWHNCWPSAPTNYSPISFLAAFLVSIQIKYDPLRVLERKVTVSLCGTVKVKLFRYIVYLWWKLAWVIVPYSICNNIYACGHEEGGWEGCLSLSSQYCSPNWKFICIFLHVYINYYLYFLMSCRFVL